MAEGFLSYDDLSVIEPDDLQAMGGLTEEQVEQIIAEAEQKAEEAEQAAAAERHRQRELDRQQQAEAEAAAAAEAARDEAASSEEVPAVADLPSGDDAVVAPNPVPVAGDDSAPADSAPADSAGRRPDSAATQ